MPALGKLALGLILFFLVLAPVLVNLTGNAAMPRASKWIARIGYLWMGGIFLFFSVHLVLDAADGLIHLVSKFLSPGFATIRPTARTGFLATCTAATGILIYGGMEAGRIRTETVIIKTEKLPPGVARLRVVQISDLHFGVTNGEELAAKIAGVVAGLRPDLLVSTGDLIDRGLHEPERVSRILRGMNAPYGKYAVTGNHEFYAGLQGALAFTRSAGFTVLRNQAVHLEDVLALVGVDDPSALMHGHMPVRREEDLLKGILPGRLTLLLKHQPRVDGKSLGHFDLQLSGHTHNGQIFPFTFVIMLAFPYHQGLYSLPGNGRLYVNRGSGTWGPPIRFLSPPEVTLIEFRREERGAEK
jgi:predicted MPP superfamily phosphohydrolase